MDTNSICIIGNVLMKTIDYPPLAALKHVYHQN